MALFVRYSKDTQFVRTGHGFYVNYSPPGEDIPNEVHYHDLLLSACSTGIFFVPSYVRSIASVFGFSGLAGSCDVVKISHKPHINTDAENVQADLNYRNLSYGFQIFEQALLGGNIPIPAQKGEHPCRHVTFSGELTATQTEIDMYLEDFDFYGFHSMVHNLHGIVAQNYTVTSVSPLDGYPTFYNYGGLVNHNIVDLLRNLLSKEVSNLSAADGELTIRTLSDVSYSLDFNGLIVQYHMHTNNLVTGQQHDWDSTIVVPFVPHPDVGQPSVGATFWADAVGPTVFSYRNAVVSTPTTGRTSDLQTGSGIYKSFAILLGYPSSVDAEKAYRLDMSIESLMNRRFLNRFKERVDQDLFDITSSSMLSTVEAFKKAEASLDNDLLQTLVKLPDIAAAFPKIREAIDVLGRLAKRDLRFSTLKEILDLATSTHLQAMFEWRPYLDLLRTYIPQMISTLRLMGDISHNSVGYGSYHVKLHDVLGRKEVTLSTRTKIVMGVSLSSLMSAILGVDALGIIPKPSNLWDLIPFTFVVNWFTGIGASMRRGEYAVLLAFIPAYYVHTYTISSPLSPDELDLLKMSNSLEEPAAMRLYYRDVSHYSPFPRDSKFGFGLPTGLPPLGTLGSLLYQLIFSR